MFLTMYIFEKLNVYKLFQSPKEKCMHYNWLMWSEWNIWNQQRCVIPVQIKGRVVMEWNLSKGKTAPDCISTSRSLWPRRTDCLTHCSNYRTSAKFGTCLQSFCNRMNWLCFGLTCALEHEYTYRRQSTQ